MRPLRRPSAHPLRLFRLALSAVAMALGAAALECQVTPDKQTIVLYPPDLASTDGRALQADNTTAEKIVPFRAASDESLEVMTGRAGEWWSTAALSRR